MQDDYMIDMNVESKKLSKHLRGSMDVPSLPSTFCLWDQPQNLSEILRSNITQNKTFKLQNSAIVLESPKPFEHKQISEFITKVPKEDKMVQTDFLIEVFDPMKKGPLIKINKFLANKEVKPLKLLINEGKTDIEERDKKAEADAPFENYIEPLPTRQPKTSFDVDFYHFDSEPEYDAEFRPDFMVNRPKLNFMNAKRVKKIDKKVSRSDKNIVEGFTYINRANAEIVNKKVYSCKHCCEIFYKKTALGGHIAKNHPNQSEGYKNRLDKARSRKIERARNDYLRTIKGS